MDDLDLDLPDWDRFHIDGFYAVLAFAFLSSWVPTLGLGNRHAFANLFRFYLDLSNIRHPDLSLLQLLRLFRCDLLHQDLKLLIRFVQALDRVSKLLLERVVSVPEPTVIHLELGILLGDFIVHPEDDFLLLF